jgi:AcrR family transcriptional regulator
MTRKEAILKSATKLFAKKGFHSTPTSEVAKVAGVAEGTIFHHFRNKEGVLKQIFEEIVDIYIDGIESQRKEASDGLEAIENVISFHIRFIEERSEEVLVILRDLPFQLMEQSSPFRETVTDLIHRVLRIFKDCIDQGKKDGTIRDLPSEKMAFILHGMLIGLSRQEFLSPIKSPDISKEVLNFCRYGLGRQD